MFVLFAGREVDGQGRHPDWHGCKVCSRWDLEVKIIFVQTKQFHLESKQTSVASTVLQTLDLWAARKFSYLKSCAYGRLSGEEGFRGCGVGGLGRSWIDFRWFSICGLPGHQPQSKSELCAVICVHCVCHGAEIYRSQRV